MSEHGPRRTGGKLVVLSGPSGSGKTTVCRRLLDDPDVTLSVSATTRPPRPGERDGVDYHFLSRDAFLQRAADGHFVEHAEYNGHLYGTPRDALEAALGEGRTVLLEIDIQGAAQVRRQYPDALFLFLDAPDSAAADRLRSRNTETEEELRRRIETAEHERRAAGELFDFHVINDDLDETVETIRRLIRNGKAAPPIPDERTEDPEHG